MHPNTPRHPSRTCLTLWCQLSRGHLGVYGPGFQGQRRPGLRRQSIFSHWRGVWGWKWVRRMHGEPTCCRNKHSRLAFSEINTSWVGGSGGKLVPSSCLFSLTRFYVCFLACVWLFFSSSSVSRDTPLCCVTHIRMCEALVPPIFTLILHHCVRMCFQSGDAPHS